MKTRFTSIFPKAATMLLMMLLTTATAWADGSGTPADPWISGGCDVTLSGGTLTVSKSATGNGAMADYDSNSDWPWYSSRSSITSIVIEHGVTSIGDYAFSECNNTNLKTVTIPASVGTIGKSAFYSCTGLTTVAIGSGVKTIGNSAFYSCTRLTSVAIGSGVETIGMYAFQNCTGLTTIDIPNSVTSIGKYAFYRCTGLTTIAIGSGVKTIGNFIFNGCNNLTTITVDAGNTTFNSPAGSNAVIETKSKTLVVGCKGTTIPDNVTSIGTFAFYGCTGLMTIDIPAGVKTIVHHAFAQCTGLTTIDIPASVTSIGEYAFKTCSNLATVTLNSNPTIGEDAFYSIKEGATVTMNLTANAAGSDYWMTFYNKNYGFTADANTTTIYKGAVNGTSVCLTAVADIPAGNAAILKSSESPIVLTLTTTASGDFTDNDLKGTDADTDASGMTYAYCLSNGTNGVGFYKYTGNGVNKIIPANRAYLIIAGSSGASQFFGFDETTGVDSLTPDSPGLSQGEGSEYFNLNGQRVAEPTKGIYIVNGKKVIVK